MVQHHLATHRGGLVHSSDEPQVGQAIFEGEPVSTMDLNRLVKRFERGIGRSELGHVCGLACLGRETGITQLGGLLGHQPGLLNLDRGFGQWMSDTLVSPDDLAPDLAVTCVFTRPVDGVTADAIVDCGHGDPLGIEANEYLLEAIAFDADQRFGAKLDVVEEHRELLVGRHDDRLDWVHGDARRIGFDDEQRKRVTAVWARFWAAGHD